MNKILAALKGLPLIRYALMLGGGIMASFAVAHVQLWTGHGHFPANEAIWLARIDAMKWLGMGALGIVALVMITLAWGKASGIKFAIGDKTVEVEMEDEQK